MLVPETEQEGKGKMTEEEKLIAGIVELLPRVPLRALRFVLGFLIEWRKIEIGKGAGD